MIPCPSVELTTRRPMFSRRAISGTDMRALTVTERRPIPCRWSALGRQGARNRRQAIAFETLDFRAGHAQVAAGGGFGCKDAVFAQGVNGRQSDAKLARNLASRTEKGLHTCQPYGNSYVSSTFKRFFGRFSVWFLGFPRVLAVVFGLVWRNGSRFGAGFRGGYRAGRFIRVSYRAQRGSRPRLLRAGFCAGCHHLPPSAPIWGPNAPLVPILGPCGFPSESACNSGEPE